MYASPDACCHLSMTEVILTARLPIAVRAQFAIRKKAFDANGRERFAAGW